MPDLFPVLRERLPRAGVRPGTVSRYLSELQEHLDDLTSEIEAEGFPTEEARQRAYSRLGSIDALALPIISNRRFHSWAARTPWAVFVLAPIVGYGLIVALLTLALTSAVPVRLPTGLAWQDVLPDIFRLSYFRWPLLGCWSSRRGASGPARYSRCSASCSQLPSQP